jgi:hypothetical protein
MSRKTGSTIKRKQEIAPKPSPSAIPITVPMPKPPDMSKPIRAKSNLQDQRKRVRTLKRQ